MEMAFDNFIVTGQQCDSKWKVLKKKYKNIVTKNNKSGSHRHIWEFFEVLKYKAITINKCRLIEMHCDSHLNWTALD